MIVRCYLWITNWWWCHTNLSTHAYSIFIFNFCSEHWPGCIHLVVLLVSTDLIIINILLSCLCWYPIKVDPSFNEMVSNPWLSVWPGQCHFSWISRFQAMSNQRSNSHHVFFNTFIPADTILSTRFSEVCKTSGWSSLALNNISFFDDKSKL